MLKTIEFAQDVPYKIEIVELDGEEMHSHDNAVEAIFVIKGEMQYICANYGYRLSPGQGAMVTPREDHSIESGGELCIIAKLYFNTRIFELHKIRSIIDSLITFNTTVEISYAHEFRNLMIRILLVAYKNTSESKKILLNLVNQIYQIIVLSISQHPCYQNSKIEITRPLLDRYDRILNFILENYNRQIQISEVAKKENISETRLSHFWKDVTGLSFQSTVTQLKMFKARELIVSSDLSIQEISILCGFIEKTHFYKHFKEQYKVSPQKYREQYLAALQYPQHIFKNKILFKSEAEAYINQYIMRYYTTNNQLPLNSIAQKEIFKEKALSNLFEAIQKNSLDISENTNKISKIICNIPLMKDKGLYIEDNEYKINWEYIYIAVQHIIKYEFNANILIDYEIMEESLWRNIIVQFQEEIYSIWGKELPVTFSCSILIRKFYSYGETQGIIKRFEKFASIYKKTDILYIL